MATDHIFDYCIYTTVDYEINKNEPEYKTCELVSEKKNGLCSSHQSALTEFETHASLNKIYCVNNIKKYLSDNDKAIGRINKSKIVIELFNFLAKNKYFLYKASSNFYQTVLNKLIEFETENDLIDINKYKKMLYPDIFQDNTYENKKGFTNEFIDNDQEIVIDI